MSLILPCRLEAWRAILFASGVFSHDYDKADAEFAKFITNRRRHRRPPPWPGGEMDAINVYLGREGKHRVCGPLHGWYVLTRSARSWPDVVSALDVIRGVPGLSGLRLPDDVLSEIADQIRYWTQVEQAIFAGG